MALKVRVGNTVVEADTLDELRAAIELLGLQAKVIEEEPNIAGQRTTHGEVAFAEDLDRLSAFLELLRNNNSGVLSSSVAGRLGLSGPRAIARNAVVWRHPLQRHGLALDDVAVSRRIRRRPAWFPGPKLETALRLILKEQNNA